MDEEPVEILAGMAERGEVDPWNIDIVDVTDRFLAELERRKELDLRISGRTLFYAACLLRMKSEYFEGWDEDEGVDGDEDEISPFDDDDLACLDLDEKGEPIERLEQEIQRRLRRRSLRKRPPITLYELLKELKTAEKQQRRKQRKRKPVLPKPDLDLDVSDVVGVAHDEGYQKAVASVMDGYLRSVRVEGEGVVTLDDLSSAMGWECHEVYIPLLFLMLEGEIVLWQDEFFGEIYVADRAPESDSGTDDE